MGSRSRVARVLTAGVPFVVIVAAFAAAVAWHLGAPARQLARFHRLVEDDRPLSSDYGDDAVVRMDRLGCRGTCPAYSVRIHGSGEIEFDGRAFVCIQHPFGDRVLRETAQRLIDAMVQVDFGRMAHPPRPRVPDAALVETRLSLAAGTARVEDDGGADISPVVAEIERQIDRVAGTARWKRIPRNDGEHLPFCPAPDGTKRVFDEHGHLVPEQSPASAPAGDRPREPPRAGAAAPSVRQSPVPTRAASRGRA